MRAVLSIGAAVGLLIGAGASQGRAQDYDLIFEKGAVGADFAACIDRKFTRIAHGRKGPETFSFFAGIYDRTYKTRIFEQASAFWHAEISSNSPSPLIVTMAALPTTAGLHPYAIARSLASKAPMQAIMDVRGASVFHAQVESRALTDADRAEFSSIVDCAK